MCDKLRGIRQSMAACAGALDARTLSADQAAQVVKLCAQIEASAAALKTMAAARIAETRSWQDNGYRSATDQLADQAGMTSSSAKRALETGQRMVGQPEVAQAALSGELSLDQATAVSDGVAADPTKAHELIDKARTGSMSELNEAVAKVKADSTDQEERRRLRHGKRSFRKWTDRDSALEDRLHGHPEDGAMLWRAIDPIRRRISALRRATGRDSEPLEALDYDALMILASAALGKRADLSLKELIELGLFPQIHTIKLATAASVGRFDLVDGKDPTPEPDDPVHPVTPAAGRSPKMAGSPTRMMIRIDLDVFFGGVALEGELCEIAGYGPVPLSVVEDLIASENPFIIGVLTKGQQVVGVYHHGRRPNAYQRSALDFVHPTCAAAGCNARAGLQYDHRADWAKTKITAFDLLDRLCPHHHARKTRDNWALVKGRGKRPFVAPEDPRHPRHRSAATAPPPPSPPSPPSGRGP
jgi:hypothetical protein